MTPGTSHDTTPDPLSDPSLRRYRARWHQWARYVAQRLVLRPVVRSVTKVTVVGRTNLDDVRGAFVVVTNHSSHLDTALVVAILPYRVTKDLAVAAAADYFYRRWWIKALTSLFFNTYPVHRHVAGMTRSKAMSARLLGEGVPVLIFPEGTRTRDGSMRRFKSGAAALCLAQDVACVPIALVGSGEAMPVGRSWPVPGRPPVTMLVGKPMRPRSDEGLRAFNDRIEAQVSSMMTTGTAGSPSRRPPANDDQAPGHRSLDDDSQEAS